MQDSSLKPLLTGQLMYFINIALINIYLLFRRNIASIRITISNKTKSTTEITTTPVRYLAYSFRTTFPIAVHSTYNMKLLDHHTLLAFYHLQTKFGAR